MMMRTFLNNKSLPFLLILLTLMSKQTGAQNWSGTTPGNIYYNSGNVGIGTVNPAGKLEIVNGSGSMQFGANSSGLGDIFRIFGLNGLNFSVNSKLQGTGNLITDLGINYVINGDNGFTPYARIGTKRAPMIRLNAEDGSVGLYGENGSGADYRTPTLNLGLMIQGNGNVGIGSTTPTEKLTVSGNLLVNGNVPYLKVTDRLVLQMPIAQENQYTRSFVGQNLTWNDATKRWNVADGVYPDFSMVRFENGGSIGFYTKSSSDTKTDLSNAEMDAYRRFAIDYSGNVGVAANFSVGGNTTLNGSIGVGTAPQANYRMVVEGKLGARKVVVSQLPNWPDYVFHKNYKLPSLKEVDNYITANQHLPDVPSAKEIQTNGLDVGENQATLLKKIEELTLYIIEQNKKLENQTKKIEGLEKRMKRVESSK